MESAELRKALECSICLKIYTEPVTLTCGHNFCRACIDGLWETPEEESGEYPCPTCRKRSRSHSSLERNISLHNIAENYRSTHQDPETRITCTYCIQSRVTAVMSCLLCDAYLCEDHLPVHSKSPEHILVDPTTSKENRKCSTHEEILKFYCNQDGVCSCASCSLIGQHKGHEAVSIDEAVKKKIESLRNDLQKLMTERENTEQRVQSLEEQRRKVKDKATKETERVTALFRDLRKKLENLEKRVLREIARQAKCESISDLIRKLEIEKQEVSRMLDHIKELCNVSDPLTVLQDTSAFCGTPEDTEEGGHEEDIDEQSNEDSEDNSDGDYAIRVYKSPTRGYLFTFSNVSNELSSVDSEERSTVDAMEQSHEDIEEGTDEVTEELNDQQPSEEGDLDVVEEGDLDVAVISFELCNGLSNIMRGTTRKISLPKFANILLDVNTADNRIHISDDGKVASSSDLDQERPLIPERFQNMAQVLSRQCFSSGKHYWEVDVEGSDDCMVGMCYPSMNRAGGLQSQTRGNIKSWCLQRHTSLYSRYCVRHDIKRIGSADGGSSTRIRIYLNYEAGQISFYEICDLIQHLYTINTTFTEPLHAALWVGTGSIKILDVSGMSEGSACRMKL